jgi:pimeloyl-ACP methyl ester carboxylesterase
MTKWMVLVTALFLTACSWTPPPTQPMGTVSEPSERRSDTLLVFLPGRGDRGPDFVEQGFLEVGAGRGYDMLAADAHFGYYVSETIVDRLHEDVIRPARVRGYEHIWLLGVSAGGLGAGLYADTHPGTIDGLILLAPYPGDEALVQDIADAGGLAAWKGESTAGKDWQRGHWRWLKKTAEDADSPQIVLGYGRDDRFAESGDLLARELPPERVFRVDGGHRWPVWRDLWERIAAADFPHANRP